MNSLAKLLIAFSIFGVTGFASAGGRANPLADPTVNLRPNCECHIVNGTIVCTCIKR